LIVYLFLLAENLRSAATEKKSSPWKALPRAPQTIALSNFLPEPTTKKNTTTDQYHSTDRSIARKYLFIALLPVTCSKTCVAIF